MFRDNAGRLLIVAAGGGCLAVLFFVVLPMLNQPAPPVTRDEIVAQVLGSKETAGDESELEAVAAAPSPLVGIGNDGVEVPVVFPAAETPAEERRVDDGGLLQALSAEDVAAARAALEGSELEPLAPVKELVAEMTEVTGAMPAEARETAGPADLGESEGMAVVLPEPEVPAVAGVAPVAEGKGTGEELPVTATLGAEATKPVAAFGEMAKAEAVAVPGVVQGPGVRRVEFDMPVSFDSRAPREVSHASGGAAAFEAAQNPESDVLPRTGVVVPGTLRGVMGYRLPLVSRQEVPDQIVSGVLIPAHTTFVILKEGSWELVDVTPEELEALRGRAAGGDAATTEVEPARKGWNPLRIFRKRGPSVD